MIETAVFGALDREPHDGLFYWKNGGEVDLLVRRGNRVERIIQVVHEGLDRPEVARRELGGLRAGASMHSGARQQLVAGRPPNPKFTPPKAVKVVPLWRYLLHLGG